MTSFGIPGHTRSWQQAILYGDVCLVFKTCQTLASLAKENNSFLLDMNDDSFYDLKSQ